VRHLLFIVMSVALFSVMGDVFAEVDAKAIHDKDCQRCHDNSIYTRPNSIIGSFGQLDARVRFCNNQARSHWNEEQILSVVEYLNNTFYKYEKKF